MAIGSDWLWSDSFQSESDGMRVGSGRILPASVEFRPNPCRILTERNPTESPGRIESPEILFSMEDLIWC